MKSHQVVKDYRIKQSPLPHLNFIFFYLSNLRLSSLAQVLSFGSHCSVELQFYDRITLIIILCVLQIIKLIKLAVSCLYKISDAVGTKTLHIVLLNKRSLERNIRTVYDKDLQKASNCKTLVQKIFYLDARYSPKGRKNTVLFDYLSLSTKIK